MANKKLPNLRPPKIEPKQPGAPKYERPGMYPSIIDPIPSRTPMNVSPKMEGTGEENWARSNFTTGFNLTPRVKEEE